jgi:hypothetical protein
MAVQLESAARLAALRDKADAVTGESSATLSGAVDALIAGFGSGGGTGENWLDYACNISSMFFDGDKGGTVLPKDVVIRFGKYSVQGGGANVRVSVGDIIKYATGIETLTIIYEQTVARYVSIGFNNARTVKKIDLSGIQPLKISSLNNAFSYCFELTDIIGDLDCSGLSSSSAWSNAFNYTTKLVNIRFVPGTIVYSANFSPCGVLSDASIQSIVDGLADLTGGTAMTLTMHADVGAKLTDAQKTAISAKNWTVTY